MLFCTLLCSPLPSPTSDITAAIPITMPKIVSELRNKKELIQQFISSINAELSIDDDWQSFVDSKKIEELDRIIDEENLDKEQTYKFIENAFRDGSVQSSGTAIAKIMPPVSRFSPDQSRGKKRETVLDKLTAFFGKFFDISSSDLGAK